MAGNKLLKKASNALQRGDLHGARRWLEKSQKANPGDFDTLYMLGTTLAQLGDLKAAGTHLERAAAMAPQSAMIQTNLGVLRKQQSDLERALQHLERALALDPRLFEAQYNHAVVNHLLARLPAALDSASEAVQLKPTSNAARLILARVQKDAGDSDAALNSLNDILQRDSQNIEALRMIGNLQAERGEFDAARDTFMRLVETDPDDVSSAHALNVLRGEAPPLAPAEYSRNLFNTMAPSFDSHLSRLGYQGPARLLKLLDQTALAENRFQSMLDIGCGTGGAGVTFKSRVDKIVGFDVAEAMIKMASRTGAYEQLFAGTIDDVPAIPSGFDLIIAADVFCYIGDLAAYLTKVQPMLSTNGLLLFTTERSSDPTGYRVDKSTGRYQASDQYLIEVAASCGFVSLATAVDNLRRERGTWLKGHYCVWQYAGG